MLPGQQQDGTAAGLCQGAVFDASDAVTGKSNAAVLPALSVLLSLGISKARTTLFSSHLHVESISRSDSRTRYVSQFNR